MRRLWPRSPAGRAVAGVVAFVAPGPARYGAPMADPLVERPMLPHAERPPYTSYELHHRVFTPKQCQRIIERGLSAPAGDGGLEGLDGGEVGGELLGAVRDLGDADACALEVEEPLSGLLEDLDGERRGPCAKVGDAAVGHCVGGGG